MPTLQTEGEFFSLAACGKLSENSRLGVGSKVTAREPELLGANLQSTLGMHFSLSENCGGSRIQTWNRYAYVANNPLANIDFLGLSCKRQNRPGAQLEGCSMPGLTAGECKLPGAKDRCRFRWRGQVALLSELVALREILINVLFRQANGKTLTPPEMQGLIDRADSSKLKKARERLAQAAEPDMQPKGKS